ncbi:hypothetical protein LTR40_008685, partial [Exophiala xenobiotica]
LRNEEQLNSMITSIMMGMRSQVLDLLNHGGDFSIRQLMAVLEPVQPNDDRPAVYTRIYYDFKKSNRLPSQYTGKTNNLVVRDHGHEGSKEKETHSNHYKTRRAATNYIMAPICVLEEENLRTVAEQVFTCLFETYTDAVLNFEDKSGNSQDDKISDIERYYNDKEASVLLMKLARSAFAKSGWPGCKSRQSYGASDGCNWNSPITEWLKGEKIIWTKLVFPENNLGIFQRTPVQVREATGEYGKHNWFYITMEPPGLNSLPSRGSFEPSLPSDVNLPPGTWVWPVIELTLDGSPHPKSWARLPSKGPWSDWDLANSWAVRIEFERDGKWQSLGLVSTNTFRSRTKETDVPGASNTYAQGVAIPRFLTQMQLDQNGRPDWQYDYGIARVKEQKLNWLQQTITVHDVQPPGRIIRTSRMKSTFDMQTELTMLGVNAFGAPFQSDRESIRVRQPKRACDSCYLHNLDGRTIDARTEVRSLHYIIRHLLTRGQHITDFYPKKLRTQCERITYNDPNKRDTCARCFKLARPCTYSRAVEDCQLDAAIVRAFLPRTKDSEEIWSIPDPQ